MPPKAKKGKRFTDPRFHYNEAYRPRIKAVRPTWGPGEITSTLNWMWRYMATEHERAECQRLYAESSEDVMYIPDDMQIPHEVKRLSDPAPTPVEEAEEEADPNGHSDGHLAALPKDGTESQLHASESEPAIESAPVGVIPAEINTTAFPFWPDSAAHIDLPSINNVETHTMKRDLYSAGFHYGREEANEKRWKGVHVLGSGTSAVASLWIRRDDNNNVEQTMTVRDVKTIDRTHWTSRFFWRDRLPKEIAIQERLKNEGGYSYNIHGYFGYRLDSAQRRYRVYTEVCEYGDLWTAMQIYADPWRTRRNLHQWNEAHPELSVGRADAIEKRDAGQIGTDTMHSQIEKERNAAWEEYAEAKAKREAMGNGKMVAGSARKKENQSQKAARRLRTNRDFDSMSDIEKGAGRPLVTSQCAVIPEDFLWHVFESLVNALTVLHQGGEHESKGKTWKEIVHRDIHSGNIFIRPEVGKEGKAVPQNENDVAHGVQTLSFELDEYPLIYLADWDFAFFDLQSSPKDYQDNPYHYSLGSSPKTKKRPKGSRYPPEMFEDYIGFADGEKLTSKTDVFGIGQIMWNMLMNFPEHHGAPFYDDDDGTQGAWLVNGTLYPDVAVSAGKGRFLSGKMPYEASVRYSKQLKDLVRMCLRYRQEDRPSVQKLKKLIVKYRKEDLVTDAKGPLLIRVEKDMEKFRLGVIIDTTDEEDTGGESEDESEGPDSNEVLF